MATTTFDTLQAAREIERAGLERAQAETIVQAIKQHGEDAVAKILAALKSEIWKAAFTATGIIVAALAVAAGTLLAALN
ncbi:MAG: hypothetical protein OXE48_03940 [Gammaproteobacteria bacterium]|nr:hypothetical protein [Gammaproteobacteria bacterium]